MAKSHKLLLILIAFVACTVAAFSTMTFSTIKADSVKASDYFYLNGEASADVQFANDNVEVTVKDGDVFKFKNKLAVKELSLSFDIEEAIQGVKINIKGTSAYATGSKNEDGEYSVNTTYVFELNKKENGKQQIVMDGFSSDEFDARYSWDLIFSDGCRIVKTNIGNSQLHLAGNSDKQKKYAQDLSLVEVEFEFTLADNAIGKFSLKSVSTHGSDASRIQTFALDEDGQFVKTATPVALFPLDGFAVRYSKIYAVKGLRIQNFSVKAYSLLGGTVSDVKIVTDNEKDITYSADKNFIIFNKVATDGISFRLFMDVDGTDTLVSDGYIILYVVDNEKDTTAPVYGGGVEAINRYTDAFRSKLVSEGSYGEEDAVYVSLGSDKYLELPSMADIVSDDTTPYSSLKYTLYYRTPTTSSSSTSNFKIPLTDAGEYSFFVIFEDANGNGMSKKDFYTENSTDSNDISFNYDKYGSYVFSFEIKDNAPIEVDKAASQGEGYIGVRYNASKFSVTASSYNEKYVLKYSAVKDAAEEDWLIIPKASEITDTEYNENGFDYDAIKAIDYNGSMAFTPDRTGYYKITCTVESDVSGRFDEATTDIIEVNGKPKTVKPDTKWLQNNVWSVVFLSVGTLCLIGIIVLLFIKPKDEDAD